MRFDEADILVKVKDFIVHAHRTHPAWREVVDPAEHLLREGVAPVGRFHTEFPGATNPTGEFRVAAEFERMKEGE